jgi:teichuronic acid biosynthesis glycosyltransferase TuaG
MTPRVSIITPMFNAARWLPETLASVRAQSLTDWEHLIVDDGSTDGSPAIVEAASRADGRIRLLRAPCHLGPSEARNLAIDSARGRFLAFLDADDLWLPEKLALSVEAMTASGYGFTYHDYRHISPDGLQVGELVRGPDELNLYTLHTRRGTGCLTVVIDREQIPVPRFPDVGKGSNEDFHVWLEIVKEGHIGRRLAYDLGRYRLSSTSRSGNKLASLVGTWRTYRTASGLSLVHALNWWIQYVWNAFWLHRYARPR